MRDIEMYQTDSGKVPFLEWFESLDRQTAIRIQSYLFRLRKGSVKKEVKSLGGGIFELRLHFGPGPRIYFAEVSSTIVLLLTGGTKRRQQKDIDKAKLYWRDYAKTN